MIFDPGSLASVFMVGIGRSPNKYEGGLYAALEGADPYDAIYQCDPRVPEEMAAFYDDLMHDSSIWLSLWKRALTDLCTYQVPLF